jgi:hypothetical protein
MDVRVRSGFAVLVAFLGTAPLFAANRTTARDLIVEPPTLISLGFEWLIDGDDNRNASVALPYRRKGSAAWREGCRCNELGTPCAA